MLLLPVSLLMPAAAPNAVLKLPVLNRSAAVPIAVSACPLTLDSSVPAPRPVLKLPSAFPNRENQPNAEFAEPVALARALVPSAVHNAQVLPGSGVSWAACSSWQTAKQTSVKRIAMIFRFFIISFFFHCFWSFVSSPCACACSQLFWEEPRTRGASSSHRVSFLTGYSFL